SRIAAPAVASTARTTTQKNQYSQPMEKPAQGPRARSAWAEKEPDVGLAADISPSMRITSTTSVPTSAYERRMPGPAVAIPVLDPTKRPAPMTPPMAIIDRWRFLSPACNPDDCGVMERISFCAVGGAESPGNRGARAVSWRWGRGGLITALHERLQ